MSSKSKKPNTLKAPKKPKFKDTITGTWNTIDFNRPSTVVDTNRGGGIDPTYFGIATSGKGRVIKYKDYKGYYKDYKDYYKDHIDYISNRIYEPGIDVFGRGSVIGLDGIFNNIGIT